MSGARTLATFALPNSPANGRASRQPVSLQELSSQKVAVSVGRATPAPGLQARPLTSATVSYAGRSDGAVDRFCAIGNTGLKRIAAKHRCRERRCGAGEKHGNDGDNRIGDNVFHAGSSSAVRVGISSVYRGVLSLGQMWLHAPIRQRRRHARSCPEVGWISHRIRHYRGERSTQQSAAVSPRVRYGQYLRRAELRP
jgi:hypothetical protein